MLQQRFPWPGRLALAALLAVAAAPGRAEGPAGLLETLHRHKTLTSTVTDNGDLNPYAVFVAPVAAGRIQQGDVLVDNFNNISNLQGTGGTILAYSPATRKTTLIARLPQHLAQVPGGVGLSTAMAMLKSGWIIVGSAPSTDGTTRTRGEGGLIVLDPQGQVATVWSGPDISCPWGNIALVDRGATATLFVTLSGFGVAGPEVTDPKTGLPVVVRKATVLRLELAVAPGQPPVVTGRTVVADGFGQRADRDVFLVGPTGLALGADGTLYVSDALENRIVAVPDALTRSTSAGTGRPVTQDGLLQRPLALALTAAGHLLACNGKNGQVVEIDPVSGKQLYAQWVDANQAQTPPGNGDLFGLAMTPDGKGFYYVEDDTNFLMEASR
jgi:hypothetical protein